MRPMDFEHRLACLDALLHALAEGGVVMRYRWMADGRDGLAQNTGDFALRQADGMLELLLGRAREPSPPA